MIWSCLTKGNNSIYLNYSNSITVLQHAIIRNSDDCNQQEKLNLVQDAPFKVTEKRAVQF